MASRTRIAVDIVIMSLVTAGGVASLLGAIKTSIVIMASGLIVCVLATLVGFFVG